MSFDLIVWALPDRATSAEVQAAYGRCRQGTHLQHQPDPRLVRFYRTITASYPDRPARPDTPWQVAPLHTAADHIEMNLHETCPDQVLLDIERLAAECGLLLFDPQDGSVYPPTPVRG